MVHPCTYEMRLYNRRNERLYLNATELQRFLKATNRVPEPQRSFALTLAYTGVRLSEARYLTHGAIQREARVLSVKTLKKRDAHHVREVPVPKELLKAFAHCRGEEDELIWSDHGRPVSRIVVYRWIKAIMATAGISGAKACPKGLRHTFGTRAILSGVPLHILQRWMGHASMKTTAIYATVLGKEQLELADKMW